MKDLVFALGTTGSPGTFLFLRPDKIKDVRLEWPAVDLLDCEDGEDPTM